MDHTRLFKTSFPSSPCDEENDPQRLPGDGEHKEGDGRAEGDEGAAEEHRRRHPGSLGPTASRDEVPLFASQARFTMYLSLSLGLKASTLTLLPRVP